MSTSLPEDSANALAKALQTQLCFTERPFKELGERVGLSEDDVLSCLKSWDQDGKLREISAVLEGSLLGYDSALVAGTVPEGDVERVAAIVSAHPTVTHNYLRNHTFNLWFTIAVPEEMGLDATLRLLEAETGIAAFHPLRRTEVFKIGVRFDLSSKTNATPLAADTKGAQPPSEEADASEPIIVGAAEARMFRALQTPLTLEPRPFLKSAELAGCPESELLAFANKHLGSAVRRYVGTFRHRKLGVRANGMVVWEATEEEAHRCGPILAAAPEVSHCYSRNAIEGFPYSLYSMAHGPDEDACRAVAKRLSEETGIENYAVLFSTQEFKKVRLRYFLPELTEWWEARAKEENAHVG